MPDRSIDDVLYAISLASEVRKFIEASGQDVLLVFLSQFSYLPARDLLSVVKTMALLPGYKDVSATLRGLVHGDRQDSIEASQEVRCDTTIHEDLGILGK